MEIQNGRRRRRLGPLELDTEHSEGSPGMCEMIPNYAAYVFLKKERTLFRNWPLSVIEVNANSSFLTSKPVVFVKPRVLKSALKNVTFGPSSSVPYFSIL